MPKEDSGVAIPIVWIGADEQPATMANQFAISYSAPEEFVLTFGQLMAPILLGTDEEKMEQLKQVAYVPVRAVGHFGLTRQRVAELIGLLEAYLKRYDEMVEAEK